MVFTPNFIEKQKTGLIGKFEEKLGEYRKKMRRRLAKHNGKLFDLLELFTLLTLFT
jgi:hypothetical protein